MLLRLTPDLVDLGQLSAADSQHLGVLGEDPLKHASAEFGQEILDTFENLMREKVAALG